MNHLDKCKLLIRGDLVRLKTKQQILDEFQSMYRIPFGYSEGMDKYFGKIVEVNEYNEEEVYTYPFIHIKDDNQRYTFSTTLIDVVMVDNASLMKRQKKRQTTITLQDLFG